MTLNEWIELVKLNKENIKTAYTEIEGEISDNATLASLNSVSRTSVYKLWIYVPAFVCWFFENYIFVVFKKDIETIISQNEFLTDRWLSTEMKKFQDGDTLVINNTSKRPYYATIDETKQIIKYVSVVSVAGSTTVKVAKADKVPLTNPELTRASAYLNDIQPTGSNIGLFTAASDQIKTPMTVYYNALRDEAEMKVLIQAAITDYLDNLPFNGEFLLSKLFDQIQSVQDVKDIVFGNFEAKPAAGVSYTPITRNYMPLAGHLVIDPSFDLDTNITYAPL